MPEVARKLGAFAATPVFIIPDEIVPGAVNVKDLPT
jgi:protein-disulfide isomerase